jgi:hypothetical protein
MSYRSNGLKVLGLSLVAVLGLMAFLAAGAQASEQAWLVEAKDITAPQKVIGKVHVEGNLEVEKETNLEILCAVIETENLELINATVEAKGKVKFKTCKAWQAGAEKAACKPVEPIVAGGKARLILHNAKNYVLFEPEVAGGNFAQIKFKEPCALPEVNNVKGNLVAECLKAENLAAVDCAQEEKVHLLKANEVLFADALTYATKAAKLLGVAAVELENGKPWCGHV